MAIARKLVKGPIVVYRKFISPLKPPTCRFYPTCSAYALEAVEVHGAVKGTWLAAKRIAKCQPFHPGGIDLVPPRKGEQKDTLNEPGELT
ncbi:MAG TPA: membrane protein insertion efficiency factor YidD [Paenibacillus sp.]|jgi:hypothetical protein